ncbi:MAG: molybdopterin-binding protein [Chitinophagaceae bacterium]
MHKKAARLIWLFFLFTCIVAHSQEKTISTDQFVIEGKVKHSFSFSLDQATQYTATGIGSIVIYNHLMQKRRVIKNIKGILVKDIIDKAGIEMASPKLLSELYITCVAADNYKVVFSWNELFNTEIGKHVMIITESDGVAAKDGKDKIAVISTADQATGRRFVKGLAKIIVEQVK